MDPKKLNELDPKLKAAYDRVMSTTVSAAPTAPAAPSTAIPHPAIPTSPATPAPHIPPPTHATLPPSSHIPIPAAKDTALPVAVTEHKSISPVILIVGGVIFFIVYALLWITVFKIKLPFLP